MLVNPEIIKDKYKCGKKVMEYLVYECNFPLLGYNNTEKAWYFANTDKLKEHVRNMPIRLKIWTFLKNSF